MDPHAYSGQSGLAPDSGRGDDSADYLRRLKKEVPKDGRGEAAGNSGGKAHAAATAPAMQERRKSPRLRCSGSVEFRSEGSDVRTWGTLTDVSLHGCYVEMNTTFPVGTKVDLVVKSCGMRMQAPGTVRASYPFLGMGISFADIEPGEHAHLKQLLAILTGRSAGSSMVSAPEKSVQDVPASADPEAFIDEITKFFQKNAMLSREEFCNIAKRVRRS